MYALCDACRGNYPDRLKCPKCHNGFVWYPDPDPRPSKLTTAIATLAVLGALGFVAFTIWDVPAWVKAVVR